MKLHELKAPRGANKRSKIVGRGSGSGHGGTSGKGHKGQNARSGRGVILGFEGGQVPLIRRIPKRGFNRKARQEFQIVNIEHLHRLKKEDSVVTLELLESYGIIKSKNKPVKLLGKGELKQPIEIKVHSASKNALEKIKKIGGKIDLIND
ncbi:50S ribosomal protein L15 [Candidatus Omnitrophota bacterium]